MVEILRTTLIVLILLFFVTVVYFVGQFVIGGVVKPATLDLLDDTSDSQGIPKSELTTRVEFLDDAGRKAVLISMGSLLAWFLFLLWYGREETSIGI